MEKTVKVEFTENVKSVVATTKIEYSFKDNDIPLSNDVILDEAKKLFNDASSYSNTKTLSKQL